MMGSNLKLVRITSITFARVAKSTALPFPSLPHQQKKKQINGHSHRNNWAGCISSSSQSVQLLQFQQQEQQALLQQQMQQQHAMLSSLVNFIYQTETSFAKAIKTTWLHSPVKLIWWSLSTARYMIVALKTVDFNSD